MLSYLFSQDVRRKVKRVELCCILCVYVACLSHLTLNKDILLMILQDRFYLLFLCVLCCGSR